MSTKASTMDYILDQLKYAGEVHARRMFGEYALYCDGKVVGLVCDDNLYLKITEAGKEFVGDSYKEGFAFPGAKASMLIDADLLEDCHWLSQLVSLTADNLPLPKIKKPRLKK